MRRREKRGGRERVGSFARNFLHHYPRCLGAEERKKKGEGGGGEKRVLPSTSYFS